MQKEFTTPSVYAEPRVRGELSFEEFKRRADKNKRIEELRAYQLSPADIMFVLDHEFSQPPEEVKHTSSPKSLKQNIALICLVMKDVSSIVKV